MELSGSNPNIVVTGTVDSIEDYYEHTDIVVIPLTHGGGVKVKVLEALGHGKLVVSTIKGIEGTTFSEWKRITDICICQRICMCMYRYITTFVLL